MTGRLALILSLFCLSSNIQAGKIQVAQWVPWNFLSKEIFTVPVDISVSEPSLNLVAGELKPKLTGVAFTLNGNQKNLSLSEEGIHSSHELNAQIRITRTIIDQIVTREFNGNVIEVRIKADCSPITVTVNRFIGETFFQFKETNHGWLPQFIDSGLIIPAGNWRISSFTCSGIGGIGEEIRNSINQALKNPAFFRDLMNEWLADRINRMVLDGWENVTQNPEIEISSIGKPSSEGVMVLGNLLNESSSDVQLPSMENLQLSAENPQLIISHEGLEKIVENKFLEHAPTNFNLQEISAFRSLMGSRIKQYFAWPDLRRFPSDAPFLLSTYKDQARVRLNRKGHEWQAEVRANGVVRTEIGQSPIDYILFGIGISTPMSVELKEGLLEITNQSAALSLAWNYALIYQLIFRPDNRIAIDILKNALKDFFSHQKIQQKLPSLSLPGRELNLGNWQEQDEFITMEWL